MVWNWLPGEGCGDVGGAVIAGEALTPVQPRRVGGQDRGTCYDGQRSDGLMGAAHSGMCALAWVEQRRG